MALGTDLPQRVRRLAAWIDAGAPAGADTLEVVTRELVPILGTDQVVAYGLDSEDGSCQLAFLKSTYGGIPELKRQVVSLVEQWPNTFGYYDPYSPPARQRNAVVTLQELRSRSGASVTPMQRLLDGFGFATRDQLRVLVCDGSRLLAWVGALRGHPFREDERRALQALVRPLQRRLALEQRLEAVPWALAALEATLDDLGAAAVVLRRPLRLLHCNAPARAMLHRDRAAVTAELRAALDGEVNGDWIITPLRGGDGSRHVLAVRRRPHGDPSAPATAAARRYGLTARQTQVLALVARGQCNKEIAAALACSVSAVEQHVSALLRRYDAGCRAQLVARFWVDAG